MEKARRCLARAGLETAHAALAEAIETLDLSPDAGAALRLPAPDMRLPSDRGSRGRNGSASLRRQQTPPLNRP
jgi:hypothetical protein